jgi:hypothetical protein
MRATHVIGGQLVAATPVDRLEPGDHACLTFSDPDERLDIPAALVADGLRTLTGAGADQVAGLRLLVRSGEA